MLKKLQFVTMPADVGGRQPDTPPKRKASPTDTPRVKRSRFRLHRTNVSKRITSLATRIKILKAQFLEACPFPGIIVDEGNNWARSCPLYCGTISCDREFHWRIQFLGQADCETRKTGEGIFTLVKEIFITEALLHVYRKIQSAGTDAASVMRSTHHFRGWQH